MDSVAEEPLSIFTAACEKFRASLPDGQRRQFVEYPDAKSMLAAINRQAEQHPSQKTALAKCCKAIAELSTKLGPYFDVISIFVSSHPEFACLVWGSLRLVFLLGTNHAQYLERVCALLSTMGGKLPAYEEFLSFWHQRKAGHLPPTRLFRAMAYVYADLVQFCFEVSQILSRRGSSSRLSLRGSFLNSLPSTLVNPFPLRFDTLLKRWDHHSQVVELEIAVLTGMDQMQATERIELILKKFLEVGMFDDKTTQDHWRNEAATKDRLRQWINAPPWMGIYETSQAQQEATSTDWFLEHGVVNGWISENAKQSRYPDTAVGRILSVQGKPGFGKTTLCSTLIERLHGLEASSMPSTDQRGCRSALAFFFFDKQRPDSSWTNALWRAVVAQLLHTMTAFDSDVIDALLLFREGRDRLAGQFTASHVEVFSILLLLIHRLDRFTLVVDGIDECQDQDHFWKDVQHIAGGPITTFAALFSRPTVEIPPRLLSDVTVVPLDTRQNLIGIQTYLRPRIADLVQRGLIPELNNLQDTTREIAGRADGMFLWATLFVEYIRSPHLSIRDRRHAIDNHNRLEGLDKLYTAILTTLVHRPENVLVYTLRTFGMVLYSFRPLHVSELAYSIATPVDRPLESDDLIPGFHRNVGPLSGALLELTADGFVRFVHLSVIEYLTDGKLLNYDAHISLFHVDKYACQVSLASCCLSYLYHTVEAEPLSGSPRRPPEAQALIRKYPLLDYATEFWSHHLLECISSLESGKRTRPDCNEATRHLMELASGFLSNGRSILVWIEASWMLKREPQVRNGPTDVFFRQAPLASTPLDSRQVALIAQETLNRARATLLQLSKDIAELNSSWAHILSDEPNEIWEPSISAFNQSRFWNRVSGAHIAARFEGDPEPGYRSVCLKTRLSPDAQRLGLVRLRVSTDNQTRSTLHFEMWSTEPSQKLDDIDLNVPRRCLKPFLADMNADFQCPVSMTANLGRVAVPGCAMVIPLAQDGEQRQSMSEDLDEATQFIDFTGNAQRNGPFPFAIEDFELGYDIQISDTGRYLMTVHRSNGIVDINKDLGLSLRVVTVYEDVKLKDDEPQTRATRPSYKYISSMAFKPNYLETQDRDANWCALLHPRYPVVAIRYQRYIICPPGRIIRQGRDATDGIDCLSSALWRFQGALVNREFRFVNKRPERLAFDHDGEYFCGVRVVTESKNTATILQSEVPSPTLTTKTAHHSNSLGEIQVPYRTSHPTTQRLGEATSYLDISGYRTISQLDRSGNGGLVLQTLREDGRFQAEMVTRLPQHIDGDYTASLLRFSDTTGAKSRTSAASSAEKNTVLFLDRENRPFQKHKLPPERDASGSPGETAELQLPLILHRERESIPTVVGWGVYDVESGIGVLTGRRKRLVDWDDEEDGEDVDLERHSKRRW